MYFLKIFNLKKKKKKLLKKMNDFIIIDIPLVWVYRAAFRAAFFYEIIFYCNQDCETFLNFLFETAILLFLILCCFNIINIISNTQYTKFY
jgi:hypothetical protein